MQARTQQMTPIRAVRSFSDPGKLDLALERSLLQITRLAALTCEVPITLIELMDDEGPRRCGVYGWSVNAGAQAPSIVTHLDRQSESAPLIIPDLSQDPDTAPHPWVLQKPHARFLFAMPLLDAHQERIGMLIGLDRQARTLSTAQRDALPLLANQITAQLELQGCRYQERDRSRTLPIPESVQGFHQRILDQTQEGIWVLENPRSPVYVNQRMADLLGFQISELLAGSPRRFILPGWRQQLKRLVDRPLSGIQEMCWRCRDGSILWTQVSVRPIDLTGATLSSDPKPQDPRGILLTVTDITTRQQTEVSLRRLNQDLEQRVAAGIEELQRANQALHVEISERKATQTQLRQDRDLLSRIMETSPVAIMMLDIQGQIRFANAQAEALFHLHQVQPDPEQTFPHRFTTHWVTTDPAMACGRAKPIEFCPSADLPFHQVIQTRQAVFNQLICFRQGTVQGHERRTDLLVNAAPLWDDSDQITSVVFVMQDITEQFRIKQAQQESEARFYQIFEQAPIGMALVLPNGQISEVNQAFCRLLGCGAESLMDHDFVTLTHPEDRGQEQQLIDQVLQGQTRSYQITKRFLRQDQTLIWAQVTSRALLGPDGQIRYVLAMVEDITERQAIERMKDEFISMVSHELRTPLTSIHGSLSLMATGRLGAMDVKAQRLLNIAVSNTERLIRLINDILDLDRIESGVVSLQKRECDAAELMAQAAETMGSLAEGAKIQLIVRPLSISLWVDPDRIIQTLTNLLSNAIRFSPPQTQVILAAQIRGEDQIRFSVTDQGRGIPPENLERIFERFQQVDGSDARKLGGTGLGLPICRSIVRQHGGRIWAESQLDHGSTFYFTLPLPEDG